jgi:hypothetical protein
MAKLPVSIMGVCPYFHPYCLPKTKKAELEQTSPAF